MKKDIFSQLRKQERQNQKKFSFVRDGGLFYLLLFLCITVVGITGYMVRERNQTAIADGERQEIEEIQISVAEPAPEPLQETVTEPITQELPEPTLPVVQVEEEEEHVQEKPLPQKVTLIRPVAGEVLKPHSNTELVYSKTMEDWRLHQGTDIRADIGATVSAAADGTVAEVGEDMRLGRYIVIDHGAIQTRYCNLASTEMVTQGDSVSKGDAIGVVGDTASFEVADEAHLHFEVIADGEITDPGKYWN